MIVLHHRLKFDPHGWLEATGEIDERGYVMACSTRIDPSSTSVSVTLSTEHGLLLAFDPDKLRAETPEGKELLAAARATQRLYSPTPDVELRKVLDPQTGIVSMQMVERAR